MTVGACVNIISGDEADDVDGDGPQPAGQVVVYIRTDYDIEGIHNYKHSIEIPEEPI